MGCEWFGESGSEKEAHVAKMVLQQEEQGGIEGRERGEKQK